MATIHSRKRKYVKHVKPQPVYDSSRAGRCEGLTPDGRQVAEPVCCGQKTRLSVYGWHCATCGAYHAFAYAHGQAFPLQKE